MALLSPQRAALRFGIVAAVVLGSMSGTDAHTPAADRTVRDVALVDAVTWGVTPSAMSEFHALGRDEWLRRQLYPATDAGLPPAAAAQVEALSPGTPAEGSTSIFELARAFKARTDAAKEVADLEKRAATQQDIRQDVAEIAKQSASRSILRALYGPDQLRQRMTWFWFNHFNVFLGKANIRLFVGDYEDTAIRPHALGQFCDLLTATLKHPAMLRYLDNAQNAVGRLNENYAREIMELHTLGVGAGYTQADVEQLARVLTGVGITMREEGDQPKLRREWQPLYIRNGLFEFNPARHDFSDKVLLGNTIKGRGFAEVEEAIGILCRHPATARRIARQIAVYFVADDPPEALVTRMAETFTATDGNIAKVLETLFNAPELTASLGTRMKDPVRFVYSAVRLAYDTKVIRNTLPIQNWLNRLGEGLFNRQTPDGYSMVSSAWNASGQMITRFEIARQIGSSSAGLFRSPGTDADDVPAFPIVQNELYFSSLRLRLGSATLAALERAVSPQDWNTLFLSSPEFMH